MSDKVEYVDEFVEVARLALPLVIKRKENKEKLPGEHIVFGDSDCLLDNMIWSLNEIVSGNFDDNSLEDWYDREKFHHGLEFFGIHMTPEIAIAILPVYKNFQTDMIGCVYGMTFEMYKSIFNTIVFALEEVAYGKEEDRTPECIDRVNAGLSVLGRYLVSMWT